MVTVYLNLGIIEGDQKRALECYIDGRVFRQRKSYDEYYIDIDTAEVDFSINDLMILAEHFWIEIATSAVCLKCK